MSDDVAVQKKPKSSPATNTRAVGSRATGAVIFHFRVPNSDDLRKKAQNIKPLPKGRWPFMPFHLAVYSRIFGPGVKSTKFVYYKQYLKGRRKTNFNNLSSSLHKDYLIYGISKAVVEWIGLTPRLEIIYKSDGEKRVFDYDIYDQAASVNAALHRLPTDASRIVHAKIGVDISDARVWKGLNIVEKQSALRELEAITDLFSDIDDQAYLSLMKNLPSISPNYRNQTPRLRLGRIEKLRRQLEELKARSIARERRAQTQRFKLEQEATSLVGHHDLYFLIQERDALDRKERKESEQSGDILQANPGIFTPSPRLAKLNDAVAKLYKNKKLKPGTLRKLEKRFLKNFEKRAAQFAIEQLNSHLRMLQYWAPRTDILALNSDIRAFQGKAISEIFSKKSLRSLKSIQAAIDSGNAEYSDLIAKYPIMQYVNFWELYWKSHKSRHSKKFAITRSNWNVLLSRTQKSIRATLRKLRDSDYIWKGEVLVKGSLERFQMYADPTTNKTHNGMLTDIVFRKMAKENKSGVIKGIILAIIAIALSLTGVGLLVAAGVVLSIVDVVLMIDDQTAATHRKVSGFSTKDPPSDFWILIAVAGVAIDVKGFAGLLKAGKGASLASDAAKMTQLVTKVEKVNSKAARLLEKGLKNKQKLEAAVLKFKKATTSSKSIGAGLNAAIEVAFYLARMGIVKFDHFVLEFSRRGYLKNIDKALESKDVIAKLDPEDLRILREAHAKGLGKGAKALERLKELDAIVKSKERELAKVKESASEVWKKRNRKGVKKNDKSSDYHTLKPRHDALMKRRDELKKELATLRSEKRLLDPPSKKTAGQWGEDVEEATRLQDGWPAMDSKTTKTIDSARAGANNTVEVMQHKTLVEPSVDELGKKVKASISDTRKNFNSQNYKDLVKQFNNDTIPKGKSHFKRSLPTDWRDPKMKIYLEIRVLSQSPMELKEIRRIAENLFSEQFPANAKLTIKNITPEKVHTVLLGSSKAK